MLSGNPQYFKYSNGKYDAYRDKSGVTLFDRSKNTYYFIANGKGLPDWEWQSINVKNQYTLPLLMAVTVVGTIAYVFGVIIQRNGILIDEYRYVPLVLVFLLIYGLLQAIVHEAAHIFTLLMHGHNSDKIGFKFDYGFIPSFFVRVNKVLLLPPGRRMTVHLAGVFVNSVINLFLLVLAQKLNWGNVVTVTFILYTFGICVNFLPFYNSDGYKTLLCMLGIKEKAEGMSGTLKGVRLASVLFILIYIVYTLYAIVKFYE